MKRQSKIILTFDLTQRFKVAALKKSLTVGQLAKVCDVRADTVRYYERIGMSSVEDTLPRTYGVDPDEDRASSDP